MHMLIEIVRFITWNYYFIILVWLMLYLSIICPLLYKFWIIPKIGDRYHTRLLFNNPHYFGATSRWHIPPYEVSIFIVAKYLNFRKFPVKSAHAPMQNINYDVTKAPKSEIFMSFFTLINFISFIFMIILASFFDEGH